MAVTFVRNGAPRQGSIEGAFNCALVNNMPDAAFGHTERQFLGLLEGAEAEFDVVVRGYSLPGVPHSPDVAGRINEEYFPFEELLASAPDAVIVTGTEPLAPRLHDEPFWEGLEALLTWSRNLSGSVLLSCLSAHAALGAFDGLERSRLEHKRTGVFTQQVRGGDPLTAGLGTEIVFPHSRVNDVSVEAIEAAGYSVLISSPEVGWSVAARRSGENELLLIQGHCEYDATSLIREYRRDVERYLSGASTSQPVLPIACTASEDEEFIRAYQERVCAEIPDPALLGQMHFDELAQRAIEPWRYGAMRLYRNWLDEVHTRRETRRRPTASQG